MRILEQSPSFCRSLCEDASTSDSRSAGYGWPRSVSCSAMAFVLAANLVIVLR